MDTKHDIKGLADLLNIQLSGIQMLREEKITPVALNAQTNAIGKCISVVKLELEVAKALGGKPKLIKGFIQVSGLDSNSVVKEAKDLVEK